MNNYIPFLKLKVNEVGALKALTADIKKNGIVPFFDLAKKEGMTTSSFQQMVKKAVTSLSRNLSGIDAFFLDNFDIDDHIVVNKQNNYGFVIEEFSKMNFIPVVGLDRVAGRNQLVFDYKRQGNIKSNAIAIRLLVEDFESFELVRDEIGNLLDQGHELFSDWILILDNRVCMNVDVTERVKLLVQFLEDSIGIFDFDSVIITGSSIPSSIRDVLAVNKSNEQYARKELIIYHMAAKNLDKFNLYLGDYTIVSPLYSDSNIPPEAMLNVTAPKIIYTHGWVHYINRGGAIKTHTRGSLQYNDIANDLITKPFYRGMPYSFGDAFLYEKANNISKGVTPSSILKPTINTHITYMIKDFVS
ncbi:beta family protein [Methylobacter tundripaludum]|uniref:beta family protein n=1 Tax=Methylobacter tundripaludum TaxID=173365 RepID=UPI0004DF3CB7|nr:hypothetical protein [Methylobacter tundripaludum]